MGLEALNLCIICSAFPGCVVEGGIVDISDLCLYKVIPKLFFLSMTKWICINLSDTKNNTYTITSILIVNRVVVGAWRDDSVLQSVSCSSIGPEFGSHHP